MTDTATTDRQDGLKEKDWLAVARAALIQGGVSTVQINAIAKELGVTRGGFYWRFKDRRDLLTQLLRDWEQNNTRAFIRAVDRAGSANDRYWRLIRLIHSGKFDAKLDAAIRLWGASDPEVAEKMRNADLDRIHALERLFVDAGQSADEAMIRARMMYYHQIGFDAVGLAEAPAARADVREEYHRLLRGF